MKNKKSFAILAGVAVIMLLAAGLIFFKKDQGSKVLDENKTEIHQTVPPKPEPRELSEEEKIKIMAENFAGSYYSYTWGEFGMIEGLYYYMTDGMRGGEEKRVAGLKEELKNQPRRYFMVRAKVINSSFIEYQENKASLDVDLEIKEIDGAFVVDTDVPKIKPNTSALVDRNGNVYNGDMDDLVIRATSKNVKISIIKVSDKWKVNRIGN